MRLERDKRFPHLCPGKCDCAVCGWLKRTAIERLYRVQTREEHVAAQAARDLAQ